MHYDVLIATPGAMLEAQYVRSLVTTLAECDKRGISYKWLNGYSSLVHHAREITATGFDNHMLDPNHKGPLGDMATYKKIFWIDSDIAWTPEDFFKLYEAEEDIISGVYLLANGTTTTVQKEPSQEIYRKKEILKLDDVFEAFSIGFGFVAVASGVFESMERPWFKHFPQPIVKADGGTIYDSMGEDLTWCLSVKAIGYKIYVDPTVRVDHLKKIPLGWEE